MKFLAVMVLTFAVSSTGEGIEESALKEADSNQNRGEEFRASLVSENPEPPSCARNTSEGLTLTDLVNELIDAKVAPINANVGRIDANVGRIDANVGRIDANVGRIDAKVGRIDAKIDREVTTLKERISAVQSDVPCQIGSASFSGSTSLSEDGFTSTKSVYFSGFTSSPHFAASLNGFQRQQVSEDDKGWGVFVSSSVNSASRASITVRGYHTKVTNVGVSWVACRRSSIR